MKEHKGQNTFNRWLFLGFGCGLTGIGADRLKSLCSAGQVALLSFGPEPFSNA
ncbi:hypothetical protein [Rhizobium giardinii]|uniref:hypothetical protein n=1 Tax=Rhizobium giardinii TaxID=56731 RepID=UPI003D6EE943